MAKFVKGQKKPPGSGRSKGTLNTKTLEVRAIAREILTSDDYLENLRIRLVTGTAPPAVEVLMHHYGYGKPKDTVAIERDTRITLEQFRQLVKEAEDDDDDRDDDKPPPTPKKKKPPPARMGAAKRKKKPVLAR